MFGKRTAAHPGRCGYACALPATCTGPWSTLAHAARPIRLQAGIDTRRDNVRIRPAGFINSVSNLRLVVNTDATSDAIGGLSENARSGTAGRERVRLPSEHPDEQGRARLSRAPADPGDFPPHDRARVLLAGRVDRRAAHTHPEHDPVHGRLRRGPAQGDRHAGDRSGTRSRCDVVSTNDAVEPWPGTTRRGRDHASEPCGCRDIRNAGVPLGLRNGGNRSAA